MRRLRRRARSAGGAMRPSLVSPEGERPSDEASRRTAARRSRGRTPPPSPRPCGHRDPDAHCETNTEDGLLILLPHFTRALVQRSLLLWGVLRLWAAAGAAAAQSALQVPAAHPLLLTPRAAIFLVAISVLGAWVFVRRNNEDRFLLLLGYSRLRLISTMAIPIVLLEVAIGFLLRAS